jgi:hypothetical protein
MQPRQWPAPLSRLPRSRAWPTASAPRSRPWPMPASLLRLPMRPRHCSAASTLRPRRRPPPPSRPPMPQRSLVVSVPWRRLTLTLSCRLLISRRSLVGSVLGPRRPVLTRFSRLLVFRRSVVVGILWCRRLVLTPSSRLPMLRRSLVVGVPWRRLTLTLSCRLLVPRLSLVVGPRGPRRLMLTLVFRRSVVVGVLWCRRLVLTRFSRLPMPCRSPVPAVVLPRAALRRPGIGVVDRPLTLCRRTRSRWRRGGTSLRRRVASGLTERTQVRRTTRLVPSAMAGVCFRAMQVWPAPVMVSRSVS